MTEYRAQVEVDAGASEVFAFLASPLNLPVWQPMLREAFREDEKRIRLVGEGQKAVAAHARFVSDPGGRHLCWAAENGVGCAGDIRVQEAPGGSVVEIVLRLSQRAAKAEGLATWTGDRELSAEEALRAALGAVKRACEGPRAAPDPQTQQPLRDSRAFGTSATTGGQREGTDDRGGEEGGPDMPARSNDGRLMPGEG